MVQNNIHALISQLTASLESCCKDKNNAEQEAWWLLEKLTGKNKTALLTQNEILLSEQEQALLKQWITQRVEQNKPLAYIIGSVPFCNLEILVRPPILIPRPETEEWVSWLIDLINKTATHKDLTILDLCCGSGCIGLALAKALTNSKVIGIDISAKAIKLSQENKILNKIENIDFIESNLYENLPNDFSCDLIVSNPPYLAKHELEDLSPEVKLWEDPKALVAMSDGMDFYHRILRNAHKFVNPEATPIPSIVAEIGPTQRSIENILIFYNIKNFKIYKDMQHQRRWVACWI